MIAPDYREPRPCTRLSYCASFPPSPVHRSGVNLCPNLIIHICQPATFHSLSLSLSRLVGTRGRGEKNKHPPRKWGYITININGSPVSSNFHPLLLLFFEKSDLECLASIAVFIRPCSDEISRIYYRRRIPIRSKDPSLDARFVRV